MFRWCPTSSVPFRCVPFGCARHSSWARLVSGLCNPAVVGRIHAYECLFLYGEVGFRSHFEYYIHQLLFPPCQYPCFECVLPFRRFLAAAYAARLLCNEVGCIRQCICVIVGPILILTRVRLKSYSPPVLAGRSTPKAPLFKDVHWCVVVLFLTHMDMLHVS